MPTGRDYLGARHVWRERSNLRGARDPLPPRLSRERVGVVQHTQCWRARKNDVVGRAQLPGAVADC